MTPKQKAKELIDKMYGDELDYMTEGQSKQCALIAVYEIIDEVYNISHQYTAIYNEETKFYNYTESKELKFWKEVIKEIEAL
jgi:hypothetical protein